LAAYVVGGGGLVAGALGLLAFVMARDAATAALLALPMALLLLLALAFLATAAVAVAVAVERRRTRRATLRGYGGSGFDDDDGGGSEGGGDSKARMCRKQSARPPAPPHADDRRAHDDVCWVRLDGLQDAVVAPCFVDADAAEHVALAILPAPLLQCQFCRRVAHASCTVLMMAKGWPGCPTCFRSS
jgi:hypothetical protein